MEKLPPEHQPLKHEVLEILRTFSRHETKRFGKFLQSPYFNKSPKIYHLFLIIKRFFPTYRGKRLTKFRIYKKLDYSRPYNDSTIRNLIYDLQEFAERYMRQLEFDKDKPANSVYWRRQLLKRRLDALNKINIDNTEMLISKTPFLDGDLFHSKLKLESDKFRFKTMAEYMDRITFLREDSDILIKTYVNLLNYFVIEALKHCQLMLLYGKKYKAPQKKQAVDDFLKTFNLEKISQFVRKNSKSNAWIFELYSALLKAFYNFENDAYYNKFKNVLIKYTNKLTLHETVFLYNALTGYCTTRIELKMNNVNNKYDKELFHLHQAILKNGYYLTAPDNKILYFMYNKILRNALKLKKITWATDFVNRNKNKLYPASKENITAYGTALVFFERGKNQIALQNLNKVNFDTFEDEPSAYELYAKLLYELKENSKTLSKLDEYRTYIAKARAMHENVKLMHYNFIDFLWNIVNYRMGRKGITLPNIKKFFAETPNINSRNWLAERIKELH
jgi:hypothetical protein